MYGHYNVRQYVLYRDGYTCQRCGAHGKDVKLHVHHRESRKTGDNAPDNLTTLCEICHKKFHKNILKAEELKKRKYCSTRDAAFMGIMRKTLMQRLRTELTIPVVETKGYITKATRTELLKLPKSHTNDALAITQGKHGFGIDSMVAIRPADRIYTIKPVRHHNRQLHKMVPAKGGIRKNNQAPKYVKGFRLFDKVHYDGRECFVWARRASGALMLRELNGKLIRDGVSHKKLALLERSSNYLIT